MRSSYQISEADYVAAARLFAKLTSKQLTIYLAIVIALVLLAIFITPGLRVVVFSGLIGGGIAALIAHYIISPILARKHYRKYKAMHEPFTIELLEDGVHFASPHGGGKALWQQVHQWRHNDRFILIYPMPRLYYIVPKSLATQGFDVNALTQALTQYVGKPV